MSEILSKRMVESSVVNWKPFYSRKIVLRPELSAMDIMEDGIEQEKLISKKNQNGSASAS